MIQAHEAHKKAIEAAEAQFDYVCEQIEKQAKKGFRFYHVSNNCLTYNGVNKLREAGFTVEEINTGGCDYAIRW